MTLRGVDKRAPLTATLPDTPAQAAVATGRAPDYSGAKIVYLATENVPGTPGQSYVVSLAGGAPKAYTATVTAGTTCM